MLGKFAAVVTFSPVFTIPGALITLLGGYCGQVYMKAQLSVKREMSTAKAPVIGVFGSAMAGLCKLLPSFSFYLPDSILIMYTASIRAYQAQQTFRNMIHERVDRYVRAARSFYNVNRCDVVYLDLKYFAY